MSTTEYTFAGVDPGQKGAMAVITGNLLSIVKCPLNKDKTVDNKELAGIASDWDYTKFCLIEKVHSMPKQGVCGVFSFGDNYGAWKQALASAGVEFDLIDPRVWKRQMGVTKDKKTSLAAALRLFPGYRNLFYGPLGGIIDGAAEATLLAYLARKTWKLRGGK
jgi:hypothetical protein